MKLWTVFVCTTSVACTYGGSDDDPLMGLSPGERTDPEASGDLGTGDDSSTPSPSTPMTPATPTTPTPGGGAQQNQPPTKVTADAGMSTTPTKPADGCGPATPVETCDPVRNTGCPPLTQCDIETSATTPTGRCVFFQATPGVPCSSSFVNVTCDAQNTCVAGACRKMCYCDTDCPPGNCCKDSSGPGPSGVFKLCTPC